MVGPSAAPVGSSMAGWARATPHSAKHKATAPNLKLNIILIITMKLPQYP